MAAQDIGTTNTYTCDTCGGRVTTIHRDAGVTPAFMNCRAKKDCAGAMGSGFYRPVHGAPPPTFEWYRPSADELLTLTHIAREHIEKGGALLRPMISAGPFGNADANPPFDGAPCPACPVETRGLYAVAFNLLNLYDGDEERRVRKLPERIQELRDAVAKMTPLMDKALRPSAARTRLTTSYTPDEASKRQGANQ